MNTKQSLRMAMKSLASSKMRAFLTMLGIIIGVASVIILVSLMEGMSADMISSFEKMGTNRLEVNLTDKDSPVGVTEMQSIYEEHKDLFLSMSPQVSVTAEVKQGTTVFNRTRITGVGGEFFSDGSLTAAQGRFLGIIDVKRVNKACVIGSYLAKQAFGAGDPIGQTLKINGDMYTVVGVLAEQGRSEQGSMDDSLYIPYTTAALLGGGTPKTFVFMTTDSSLNEKAQALLKIEMMQLFKSSNSYYIMDNAELINAIKDMDKTMTMVLVGIASISLLVGGIGIMNIMLVSVTERTREIGIRKSLGAKRRDIMRQFVIEAAATSSAGGIVGILLGIIASLVAGAMMNLPVVPSVMSIVLSFGVSVAIGIFFGFMPARKAAELNPIDALRYE